MNPLKELPLFELFPYYIHLVLCMFFKASSCATERQCTGFGLFEQQQSGGEVTLSLADSMLRWIGLRHAKITIVIDEFRYREILYLKRLLRAFPPRASG